jgi:hypothetical protein
MLTVTRWVVSLIFMMVLAAGSAYAQATRTWVSGVGDDANPCSRTAPCKTFAGAISKTAAGGEIDALDPGGFGAVTITKAITIDGGGNHASVLVAGTNGINVAAGVGDTVILRNLGITGVGLSAAPANPGLIGIRYTAGSRLVVEKCTIEGFSQNGIDVSLTGDGNLEVNNTSITRVAGGIHLTSTTGRLQASLDRVHIRGSVNGVDSLYGQVQVSNSVITQNSGVGIFAEGGSISVVNSMLTSNGIAVQSQTGATVRLSNNDVYDNLTGFACGGGTLASTGDNRKGGNVGGSVTTCAPNATVSLQ